MSKHVQRFLPLALVVVAGVIAILTVQCEQISTRASPQAMLMAVADAQHELTRAPMKLDRMTDVDEIALGDVLAKEAAASLGPATRIP